MAGCSLPREKARKPNAIVSNEHTHNLLVLPGIYVLVKRFTAKKRNGSEWWRASMTHTK